MCTRGNFILCVFHCSKISTPTSPTRTNSGSDNFSHSRQWIAHKLKVVGISQHREMHPRTNSVVRGDVVRSSTHLHISTLFNILPLLENFDSIPLLQLRDIYWRAFSRERYANNSFKWVNSLSTYAHINFTREKGRGAGGGGECCLYVILRWASGRANGERKIWISRPMLKAERTLLYIYVPVMININMTGLNS